MKKTLWLVAVLLLVAIPVHAAKPVNEEAYKKAKQELKTQGSVPLVDALKASKGSGHLEGFRPTPQIVGGTDANISELPWQVSIAAAQAPSNLTGHFCGGSLIKPNWVVTAAHCLDGETLPKQIKVVTGTDDLNSGGKKLAVTKIIIHPKYNADTNNNDIALVKLAGKAKMQPISLISKKVEESTLKPDALVTVSGWGYTKENGDVSPKLQEAEVPIVDRQKCNAPDAYDGSITDNMICAASPEGGVDSCQGDSGGPLVVKKTDGKFVLAGIVSWGEGCARAGKPGVYTRVSKYVSWVNQKTKPQ
jgi:secreted trypsin-like serine protease